MRTGAFLLTLALTGMSAHAADLDTPPGTPPDQVTVGRTSYRLGLPGRTDTTSSRFRTRTFAERISYERVEGYRTMADYPDYQRGFYGNGIIIPVNGYGPRNFAAIGVQSGDMRGGGCVPADVSNPSAGCATPFATMERERWTFRMSYLDPTTNNELNIGFGDIYGFTSDDVIEWVAHTTGNHSCFTFYPCDTYGLDLDEITDSVRAFAPSCTNKLGAGYKALIYYQYSRYRDTASVPAGAVEWEPATVAATANRLDKPGYVLWSSDWRLGVGENAVSMGVPGVVHPGAESNTGYNTVAPTIAPSSGTVTVTSYDCGVLPNVAFTITRAYTPQSAGHAHTGTPSPDEVNRLQSYSGTTDANGSWTTTLNAGRVSGLMTYTLQANVNGQTFTAKPSYVTTGFVSLLDPGVGTLDVDIRYTGNSSVQGLRHPNNHNGSPELHTFVRDMATMYNIEADPGDRGSIGLNDMSLELGGLFDIDGNFSPSPGHFRHRFGTDCDIDQSAQTSSGTPVAVDQDTLERIVTLELSGIFLKESKNRMHVQVPEDSVGEILLREAR